MLKKSEFLKNKKCILLLCVEILLILLGIFGALGQKRIVAGTEQTNDLLGEGIALPPGVYTARIYYETQENNLSHFGVKTEEEKADSLRSNQVLFPSGVKERECQFYLLDRVEKLNVFVEPNGAASLQIKGVEIEAGPETAAIFTFWVLLSATIANGMIIVSMYHKRHPLSSERQLALFGVPGAALLASLPLMTDYVLIGADVIFHLGRIEALAQSILSGAFFSRIKPFWLSGHGYASSVFYGDTFLIFPALLRIIGFDLTFSYQMFVLAVNIMTAWIAYVSFRKCFKSVSIGVLGAILYTLAPYRIYNIYNRAAAGEYVAMAFLPLLMWGFYKIFTEDISAKEYRHNWLIPVLGFSGIIQSHALSCEMAGIFVILLCLILWKKVFRRQTFLVLTKTVVMTILVNAWFLIPFLDLMLADKYHFGNNANVFIQNRGIPAALLFYTSQAAGASSRFAEAGLVDAEPIGLGAALLFGAALWLVLRLRSRKVQARGGMAVSSGDAAFVLGCTALFMSTCYFPWDWLSSQNEVLASLIGSLQFPTRLTVIATICMAAVTCVVGKWLLKHAKERKRAYGILTGLGLLSVLFGMYQLNDILYTRENFLRIYSAQNIGSSTVLGAEYLPLGTSLEHMTYHEPVSSAETAISNYNKENLEASAYVETGETEGEQYVEFPMLYYKGYHAKVTDTGEQLQVVKGTSNDVRVLLPENFAGNIQCSYDGMWYWHISDAASILSCAVILVSWLLRRHRQGRLIQKGNKIVRAERQE